MLHKLKAVHLHSFYDQYNYLTRQFKRLYYYLDSVFIYGQIKCLLAYTYFHIKKIFIHILSNVHILPLSFAHTSVYCL